VIVQSSADEIVKAVLYPAFDNSSYIRGIESFVDGGTAKKIYRVCNLPWVLALK